MSIRVDLHPTPDDEAGQAVTFDDGALPASGGVYCYHVGSGGQLIILIDEQGESRVERVYSPSSWRCVEGDVWRKGMLLQG
jgi:hypothetical protein